MESIKAVVVGRHAPDFGSEPVEVVSLENVTFPASADGCVPIILELCNKAKAQGAVVLLQNTPGQVAVAISRLTAEVAWYQSSSYGGPGQAGLLENLPTKIGVIITKPSNQAPTPNVREYSFFTIAEETFELGALAHRMANTATQAVLAANPNARVELVDNPDHTHGYLPPCDVRVTVQAPRPFEFDHIEWF